MPVLAEVRGRLWALRGVPRFRKDEVLKELESKSEVWLADYLEQQIAWLERFVEPQMLLTAEAADAQGHRVPIVGKRLGAGERVRTSMSLLTGS